MTKAQRPPHCEPGSITDTKELGQRLRLSRERLASSELTTHGRAWRLWAACVEATFGYAREADTTYATTLGKAAGVDRWAASDLLKRFDELGVFVWNAAPRGSRGISELRLPTLAHVAPTPPVEATRGVGTTRTRGVGASLHSYTPEVLSHDHVGRSGGHSNGGEPEHLRAQSEEPTSGEHEAGPVPLGLEGLSLEELQRGALEYGPTMAALYRDELERRARKANPLRAEVEARFGDS